MIGLNELRAMASNYENSDPEFADLLTALADRREHAFDELVLAPLLHAVHPDLPDGRTWEQLPADLRDRIAGAAAAIRGRLEELGWKRPDVPGRTWQHPTNIPEGVLFYDGDGHTWRRSGADVVDASGEHGLTYRANTFEVSKYREVLPA
ncbi:hypothetical protein FEK35_27150 [Nocardia cyriacigeorgica]|uniref:Uncharacterized protein n=1 Tax=Nocardia cyriacigeorgica TaxID=135487 RepID=A0A5R8P6D8_9NOCA|nr:hypothetical protein [Nocardia cyriacigeorgica]TLF96771.1 hypothetical protein FEK35_27150 [Nocardia cyriacigeorgica]